jgi:hypothetical protein
LTGESQRVTVSQIGQLMIRMGTGANCQIFQDPIVSPILGLEIHIIKEKVEQSVNSSDPFCKSYFGLADRNSKRDNGRQIYLGGESGATCQFSRSIL